METGASAGSGGPEGGAGAFTVDLSTQERDDLADLLTTALGDMSSEIADTDNPGYRAELMARRDRLRAVAERVAAPRAAGPS
jgi:hypothetical protein